MSRTDRAGRQQPFRIKICCIADLPEAELAGRAGADFLGFVGPMPDGPGILTHDAMRAVVARFSPPPEPVLLTSAPTAEGIVADAAAVGVTTVQVVRHIAPAEAAKLAQTSLTVLQVVHVEGPDAIDLISVYAPHCDAFLLDSGRPSKGSLGGTGRVHDWAVSTAFVARSPRPVFLAGGLTPENVAEAVQRVRPDGLDVCSGLRVDGRLMPNRLAEFVTRSRAAEEAIT